jgi:hypothetical protein
MAGHNDSNSDRGPGRPPLEEETVYVQIKLSLRPGRDDDLIAFFASLPHGSRATAVMTAMRSGNLNAAADPNYVTDEAMTDALDALIL